ncbi:phosphorylase superfamily protein, partial [Vibrio parahaemolyticus V-223/04]
RHIISA